LVILSFSLEKVGKAQVETIESISTVELEKRYNTKQIPVLNVRRETEYMRGLVRMQKTSFG